MHGASRAKQSEIPRKHVLHSITVEKYGEDARRQDTRAAILERKKYQRRESAGGLNIIKVIHNCVEPLAGEERRAEGFTGVERGPRTSRRSGGM